VVNLAKAIARGEVADAEAVEHSVYLVLEPGVWFWGIKTRSSGVEIAAGCKALLDNELVAKTSEVSL
jgi:hypothetical protein